MRSRLYLLLLAFTATLAAVVGWRLPSESLVVALGVIAGVLVSVPTSLIVAWIATRDACDRYDPRPFHPAPPPPAPHPDHEPRVVIIQPPASQAWPSPGVIQRATPSPTFITEIPGGPRRFTFITPSDDPDLDPTGDD